MVEKMVEKIVEKMERMDRKDPKGKKGRKERTGGRSQLGNSKTVVEERTGVERKVKMEKERRKGKKGKEMEKSPRAKAEKKEMRKEKAAWTWTIDFPCQTSGHFFDFLHPDPQTIANLLILLQ